MPTLSNATQQLITTLRDAAAGEREFKAAGQAFLTAAIQAPPEQAGAAIRELAALLDDDDLPHLDIAALMCGSLVERGCDPQLVAGPIMRRTGTLLPAARRLFDAALPQMPDELHDDQDDDQEQDEVDREQVFETLRQQFAGWMPQENHAWELLGEVWPAAIAVLSRSPSARAAARPLREPAHAISEFHAAGHWLWQMLSVLDREPLLVIEPQTSLGIVGTISGISENFQLNVLLMDQFPKRGWFARRRVPKRAADNARGIGPQQADDIVTGVWNLYTWRAIQPGLTLPDPNDDGGGQHWVWNEGIPEDIPVFEKQRVVLLGPRSYPRSWRAQRTFDLMPGELAIERRLTAAEARDWLQRMLAAKETA